MNKSLIFCMTLLLGLSFGAQAQLYPNGITAADGKMVSDLETEGWTTIYYETYGTALNMMDIDAWRTAAANGYILLAGVDNAGSIVVGASGLVNEVLTETNSTSEASAYASSNLFWYNYPDYSIGFTRTLSISLNSADITGSSLDGDPNNSDNPWRLSWHSGNFGGWRAANITWLNNSTSYFKLVMILNPDTDDDGFEDDVDACPHSSPDSTVSINQCQTDVANVFNAEGCNVEDQITQCIVEAGTTNHGAFVSCVSHLTNDLKNQGLISGQDKGAIQSCAARSKMQ